MTKTVRFWRWRIDLRRGGRATPWPWTEVVISRRRPRVSAEERSDDTEDSSKIAGR